MTQWGKKCNLMLKRAHLPVTCTPEYQLAIAINEFFSSLNFCQVTDRQTQSNAYGPTVHTPRCAQKQFYFKGHVSYGHTLYGLITSHSKSTYLQYLLTNIQCTSACIGIFLDKIEYACTMHISVPFPPFLKN